MNTPQKPIFTVLDTENILSVERIFNAPLDLVWSTWTEGDLLDRWWAPKPYVNQTVHMDFTPGGRWFYYMQSPAGERHYCMARYQQIEPQKGFTYTDAFCDENMVIIEEMPQTKWDVKFVENGDNTKVHIQLLFDSKEALERLVQLGFKEGFTAGMENLDQYISAQFYLRKKHKPNNNTRVTWYLNFPGNTEEALLFYKDAFQTEFIRPITRFQDIPEGPQKPDVPDNIKHMVLHSELRLLGEHVLMATDAPKEMGFEVRSGNNMHINIEPDSKKEADRLFHALSAGGIIEMPMKEMFWGAYFGSFMDKYGINWMVNYQPK